ncbi:MAG: diaminopimelate epimerase [Candidatus Dormibacteraeota bacterium]|nr:diaminopimelate epimerase [Candidatus Dormibacteraeota bacterium]
MQSSDQQPSLIRLTKYEALGNDYLVWDQPASIERLARLAPRICDRHRGVGADGILAFDAETLSVRVFNPDGSEAEKSGNGLRIAVCHAVLDHGAGQEFELRTADRPNSVRVLALDGGCVESEVDMGHARLQPDAWVEIETPAGVARCRLVDVGNPHCVVFDQPVTPERCRELGPWLERDDHFPQRTNVQLVEVLDRRRARIEIWERGAGYTLASGSSATAVAAVLIHLGLTDPELEMVMPGGVLQLRESESGSLLQSGPARRVFSALLDPADLEPT